MGVCWFSGCEVGYMLDRMQNQLKSNLDSVNWEHLCRKLNSLRWELV
jgi:hypothetical protein